MIDLTEDSPSVSSDKNAISNNPASQENIIVQKVRELPPSLQTQFSLNRTHPLPTYRPNTAAHTLQKVQEIPQTVQISQAQAVQRVRQLPPTMQLGFGPNMINPLTLNLPATGNYKAPGHYGPYIPHNYNLYTFSKILFWLAMSGPTFYKPLQLQHPGFKPGVSNII